MVLIHNVSFTIKYNSVNFKDTHMWFFCSETDGCKACIKIQKVYF